MKTRTLSLIVLICLVAVCCFGAARADVAAGSFGSLAKIKVGDAAPKTKKGSSAVLRVVRVTDADAFLIWDQRGKKALLTISVPAVVVPHLAPTTVGRTREFMAFVEGEGKDKEWFAFELVPESVP